jgi:hypothetical protein
LIVLYQALLGMKRSSPFPREHDVLQATLCGYKYENRYYDTNIRYRLVEPIIKLAAMRFLEKLLKEPAQGAKPRIEEAQPLALTSELITDIGTDRASALAYLAIAHRYQLPVKRSEYIVGVQLVRELFRFKPLSELPFVKYSVVNTSNNYHDVPSWMGRIKWNANQITTLEQLLPKALVCSTLELSIYDRIEQ